jgi:hypothetical protein
MANVNVTLTDDGKGAAAAVGWSNPISQNIPYTIHATPSGGKYFMQWVVISGSVTIADDRKSITTFQVTTGLTATIEATFSSNPVLTVRNDGQGTTSPSGSVYANAPRSVVATATNNCGGLRFWRIIYGTGITITDIYNASITATLTDSAIIEAVFIPVYNLASMNTLAGTLKSYLYVDTILPALTVPTGSYIISMDEIVERIDVDPGVIDIENVNINIQEDYSTYSEGFWSKIINGYISKTITSSGSFSEGTNTIVRTDGGSFILDGWLLGMIGGITQTGANNGLTFTVAAITDSTVTTIETLSVVAAATCTLTSQLWPCDIQLMLTLVEDGTETFLFRGSLYRENTDAQEFYVNGTTRIRGFKSQWISMLGALKNVSTTALIQECKSHTTYYTTRSMPDFPGGVVLKMGDLLSCILKLSYNTTFSSGIINSTTDLQFTMETETLYFTDLYMMVGTDGGDSLGVWTGYFDVSAGWQTMYATAFDLLRSLASEFCFIPRYTFGTSAALIDASSVNNIHTMTLYSRGRSSVNLLTMASVPFTSDFLSVTTRKTQNIRATDRWDNTLASWAFNGVLHPANDTAFPSNAQFDIDATCDFNHWIDISTSYVISDHDTVRWRSLYQIITIIVGGDPYPAIVQVYFDACNFWNYQTKAYQQTTSVNTKVNPGVSSALDGYGTTMVYYLFYRLSPNRYQYTREYVGISANDTVINSQRALHTLARHQIDEIINGVTVHNIYYATEVHKNILKNTCKVVWVAE